MPPDPTANLGSKRLATLPDYIGHVAPDFRDRKHFNSLVVRPQYRLSLRIGDLEELFPHKADTPEGRMERMQVLGLFYYPLGHARAREAFDGMPLQPAVPATATDPALPALPAVPGLWDHFRTRVMNGASYAQADQEIQRLLKEWIVNGGALPAPAAEGATPADTNFVKFRIPGAFTLMKSWRNSGMNLNDDPAPAYADWTLGKDLYDVETQFRTDNPLLGKIPLVAKVEKFDTASAKWKPAKDAQVFFQLIDPYALPAFDATKAVNAQFNRPPLRDSTLGPPVVAAGTGAAGPGHFASPEETPTGGRAPNATDPQRGNCPRDRGGEQGKGNLGDGTDVANVLFSTTSTKGLNEAHTAPATGSVNPITRTNFFPLAERVNDSNHLHAVKAKTNADGEAAVLFTPSRCGGDRYRFRVYIGPPTIPGATGTGAQAVAVETGTLVSWRHLRISRYIQQPAANVDPTLLADANTYSPGQTRNIKGVPVVFPSIGTGATAASNYLRRGYVVDAGGTMRGLNTGNFSMTVPAAGQFDSLPVQWARAFVEVEIDRAAQGSMPEVLSNTDWNNARAQAFRDGQVGMAVLGLDVNLERLMYLGAFQPGTLNVTNAVTHLPLRSVDSYHGPATTPAVPATQQITPAGANSYDLMDQLISDYLMPGFVRWLTRDGFTPGLTLIQGAYGNTWIFFWEYSSSSGESFDYRGGTIWGGAAAYPNTPLVPSPGGLPWANYGFTSNSCHEIGHVCFCLHANPPEPGNAIKHDPVASNLSVCVMSYQNCEGQFCAKCLFALRGWDVATLTY